MGAGGEIIGIEFVEAGTGKTELMGGLMSVEVTGAELSEDVTDQWSSEAPGELVVFFMGAKSNREGGSDGSLNGWIYRFGTGSGSGPARRRLRAAEPAVCQTSDGARVASPQGPILRRSDARLRHRVAP